MARKIEVDLEHPIDQAGAIAKNIVDGMQSEFGEVSREFIDDGLIDSLIAVAMQSRIDDSPLVVKQKIRNIIRAKLRKSQ
jgi:hypothetical protein